jgi:hypothetical protein
MVNKFFTIKSDLLFPDSRVFGFFSDGVTPSSDWRDFKRFVAAYSHLPGDDLAKFGPYHLLILPTAANKNGGAGNGCGN